MEATLSHSDVSTVAKSGKHSLVFSRSGRVVALPSTVTVEAVPDIIRCLAALYDEYSVNGPPVLGLPAYSDERSPFQKFIEEMQTIHRAKDADYAGSTTPYANFMGSEEIGIEPWRGALLRMRDKWRRLVTLLKGQEQHVKDESIHDTLVDLANYAAIVDALRGME